TARHGKGLPGYDGQSGGPDAWPCGVARHPARSREHTAPTEAFREPGKDGQTAPSGRGRGCRLPDAARTGPDGVPEVGRLRLDPRTTSLSPDRAGRGRQVVARLRAWLQGLPGESVGSLSARATAVRRVGAGPRRRPLRQAAT